jgi:hypothetical protein
MSARNTDWNNATAGRPLSLDDIKRAVRDLGRGWPWMVLDIDATTNARTIKKAYAAAIRANPPEGDAAAFQRVQEAYEVAMESAMAELPRPSARWNEPDYGVGVCVPDMRGGYTQEVWFRDGKKTKL